MRKLTKVPTTSAATTKNATGARSGSIKAFKLLKPTESSKPAKWSKHITLVTPIKLSKPVEVTKQSKLTGVFRPKRVAAKLTTISTARGLLDMAVELKSAVTRAEQATFPALAPAIGGNFKLSNVSMDGIDFDNVMADGSFKEEANVGDISMDDIDLDDVNADGSFKMEM